MQLHLFLILHVQTAFMFIRDTFFSINSQNCLMNEKIRDETLGKRICIIMKLTMKWHAGSTVGKVNIHITAKRRKTSVMFNASETVQMKLSQYLLRR